MTLGYFLIAFFAFVLVVYVIWHKAKETSIAANKLVKGLENTGFFKYTDTPGIGYLKDLIKSYYEPGGWFLADIPDLTERCNDLGVDLRYNVFSRDDFFYPPFIFGPLGELFEAIGLDINTPNYTFGKDENGYFHQRAEIRGREYKIFENYKIHSCADAAVRFFRVIEAELIKQEKEERVYLADWTDDCCFYLLTPAQYFHVEKAYTKSKYKPLPIEEWAVVMGVIS